MNKKLIGGIAVNAIAVATTLNLNYGSDKDSLSSLALANIEALTDDNKEDPVKIPCEMK